MSGLTQLLPYRKYSIYGLITCTRIYSVDRDGQLSYKNPLDPLLGHELASFGPKFGTTSLVV